ncbi:hypothetical protein B5S33_g1732 [[Candida] boidinii]|nr:hypothetical protein B5S30_g253 [[Candida] boidinii]OWB83103.1 hypothetical protein B5S33_g1732 [[Candida] boidinii]GMF58061.1 unnamed protein product [[Candida] boidinii]
MSAVYDLIEVFKREDTCELGNDYNGDHWGARISAVFVIWATSSIGAFFPILSSKYSFIKLPNWCFFGAKYFGSGVIVATSFIHLLEPASDALGEECLGAPFTEYPMAFGICLIVLMVMFFLELIAYRWVDYKLTGILDHSHSHFGNENIYVKSSDDEDDTKLDKEKLVEEDAHSESRDLELEGAAASTTVLNYPKHFQHAKDHQDPEVIGTPAEDVSKESYYGQLLNIFVLEFGILFHSVFIGISLSVAGDEFVDLYIVIVFHQMFEGLGLGTRIALVDWPKSKRWTPWLLALAYGLCTPISVAIGLGVRNSYSPGSRTALVTNGVFDSISAGILIYTGLIELMAHEFLFSDEFKGVQGFKKMFIAYIVMCVGAGLMALLGKWA